MKKERKLEENQEEEGKNRLIKIRKKEGKKKEKID
jgi:hypothetical protein